MAKNLRAILSDGVPRVAVASRLELGRDAAAEIVAAGADVLEARLDLVAPEAMASLEERVQELAEVVPVLATIRSAQQGGRWVGTDDQTLELYRRVLSTASAVDIELGNGHSVIWDDVHRTDVTTIASYHDFTCTPKLSTLRDIRARGNALGADYVKIAVNVQGPDDLRTLTSFASEDESRGVIPIGMSAFGTASRVFFPLMCVPLCYSFVGKTFAPGQMELPRTVEMLRALSPEFNQHFVRTRSELGPA